MNSIEYLDLEAKMPEYALKHSKLRELILKFESKGRFRARKGKEFSSIFFYDIIPHEYKEDVTTWNVLDWLTKYFPHINLTITIEIDCSKYRVVMRWGQNYTQNNVLLCHSGSCRKCRKKSIRRQFMDADTNCMGFRLAEQPLKGFSICFDPVK